MQMLYVFHYAYDKNKKILIDWRNGLKIISVSMQQALMKWKFWRKATMILLRYMTIPSKSASLTFRKKYRCRTARSYGREIEI